MSLGLPSLPTLPTSPLPWLTWSVPIALLLDQHSIYSLFVSQQTTPNINVILKPNVSTDGGSTTVDGPAVGWPTGNGFQINFVQQNPTGVAILVQSQQFNITGTTTPFTSLISSTSST